MKKIIRIIFFIIFAYILLVLFLPSDKTYLNFRRSPVIPNIISGIISLIVIIILYKMKRNINDKIYKKILTISSIIVFIIQFFILKNIYFYTDWDVKTIRDIITNNTIKENYYLTKYPNTLLYVAILKGYRLIPIIGKYYFPLLVINALLVNLSGIITSLTIKRYTNNYNAIIGYVILSFITILSPWINIPYSDTFVILIPITIIYIYSKNNKNIFDYFLIGFLSILGYYIKPTAFIILIAITIISIINLINKESRINIKIISTVFMGMITSFAICKLSIQLTGFIPAKTTRPFDMIHYLAMGQNNETYGQYNEKDVEESDRYGKTNDIKKTMKNIEKRKIIGQFKFLRIKTLLNYNDGTFSWGGEGDVFFYKVLAKKTKLSTILKNYFYKDYKYNNIFRLITQVIWILILSLTIISGIKYNDKYTIIYLSLVGITIFLTIFECRARYLYCYTPIFVTASMIGLHTLKTKKEGKEK